MMESHVPMVTDQSYVPPSRIQRDGSERTRSLRGRQSSLLLHNQWRVVVENQPPVPLLLYPYSRKAVVTGDSFASVLPIHCGAASLDSRVSVDAHLNLVGGDRLKFQFTGRKI